MSNAPVEHGGPDLEATTSRNKRSRPDVAERIARNKTREMKVVKMTLNTFGKDKRLNDELRKCSEVMTRLCIETSRMLNLYVLHTLADSGEIPKMDQTFFNRAFTGVAAHRKPVIQQIFGPVLDLFEANDPVGREPLDMGNISQMANYAAAEYLTACANHVAT